MNYKQTSTKELVTYSLIIYQIKMYTHTNLCISDFCHFEQIERHYLHYHMHHAYFLRYLEISHVKKTLAVKFEL